MLRRTDILLGLSLTASAAGCGGNPTQLASTAAASISSRALFNPLQGFPADVKAGAYAELGSLRFSQLYERLLPLANDQAVLIDGVRYADAHRHLLEARNAVLALDQRYPRVEAAWTAAGSAPTDPRAWSYQQFKAALEGSPASPQRNPGLNLGDQLYPVVTSPNFCDPWADYLTRVLGVNLNQLLVDTQAVRGYCGSLAKASAQTLTARDEAHLAGQPLVSVVAKCAEPDNSGTIVLTYGGHTAPFTDSNAFAQYCETTDKRGMTRYAPPFETPPHQFEADPQFWTRNNSGPPI